ncbi:hypothetical protein [Noviherbaspirillum galbum]|uniref:Uncharacterized protein n=1 Tax=Noviherbaspirillum galbum TaxID=2709383 RepID=A0A6B3SHQ9_9BURK|nr:hypothetical protein [Noviherbaspirillum galbum]NEX60384.1 hypothetical protein [Noviherbaspirillum galbum]
MQKRERTQLPGSACHCPCLYRMPAQVACVGGEQCRVAGYARLPEVPAVKPCANTAGPSREVSEPARLHYFEVPLEEPLVEPVPVVPLEPEDFEEPDMLEPDVPLAPDEESPARRSQPVKATPRAATTSKTDEVLAMDFIVVPFIKNGSCDVLDSWACEKFFFFCQSRVTECDNTHALGLILAGFAVEAATGPRRKTLRIRMGLKNVKVYSCRMTCLARPRR